MTIKDNWERKKWKEWDFKIKANHADKQSLEPDCRYLYFFWNIGLFYILVNE